MVDNSGRHGEAITLNDAAQAALLAWVSITLRLANARMNGAKVIEVYGPTLDSEGKAKGTPYDYLQDAIN